MPAARKSAEAASLAQKLPTDPRMGKVLRQAEKDAWPRILAFEKARAQSLARAHQIVIWR